MENYQIEQRIRVDFAHSDVAPRVYAKQYDNNTRVVAVSLLNNNQPYTIPEGYSVNVRLNKKDGHYVYNPALIGAENTVLVVLTRQMLTHSGELPAEIEVVQGENTLKTATFVIDCRPSAVPEDAIESADEYKTIQEIAKAVEDAAKIVHDNEEAINAIPGQIADIRGLVEQAEAARDDAEEHKIAACQCASAAADRVAEAATKAEEAAASAAKAAESEDKARQHAEQAASATNGYKGFFVDPEALRKAYPVGENGWIAAVGRIGEDTQDTIWAWDSDANDWIDTNKTQNWKNVPTWEDLSGKQLVPCNCIYSAGTHEITHQSVKQIPGSRYTIIMVPTHAYTEGDAVTVAGEPVELHYGISNVDVRTGAWKAGKPIQVEVSNGKLYIPGGPPALEAPRSYSSKPITGVSYQGNTTITGTPSPDSPATLTPMEPPAVPGAAKQIGPLWSLPDGTKDTYSGETGVLVRWVGRLVLDGTSNIGKATIGINTYRIPDASTAPAAVPADDSVANIYCDRMVSISVDTAKVTDSYGISIASNSQASLADGVIRFSLPTSVASTVEAAKAWLSAHPLTIYYPMAYPTVERIIYTGPIATRATDLLVPSWTGKTTVTGTPSPDNPATITGVPFRATATGPDGQSQSVNLGITGYSLPDETADSYNGDTGELVQRVGKLTLNGTETWSSSAFNTQDGILSYRFFCTIEPMAKYSGVANVVSEKFHTIDATDIGKKAQYAVSQNTSDAYPKQIILISPKSADTLFSSVDTLKSYLSAQAAAGTPVVVYYKLAEPIAYNYKADITAFEGQTTVTGADAVGVIEGRVLRVADCLPYEMIQSNPNLLDDWYFANPINQRGATEYSVTGNARQYSIDRWSLAPNLGTVKLQTMDGFIRLTKVDAGGTNTQSINQFIDRKELSNSIVTLSMLVRGNSWLQLLFFVEDKVAAYKAFVAKQDWDVYTLTYTLPKLTTKFAVHVYPSTRISDLTGYCDIIAAKLELGTQQTLARKVDDQWVLNDPPPDPALELLKCQRYFIRAKYSRQLAYSLDNGQFLLIPFNLPVPMRIANPSISNFRINDWINHQHKGYDRNIAVSKAVLTVDGSIDKTGQGGFTVTMATPLENSFSGELCCIASMDFDLSADL